MKLCEKFNNRVQKCAKMCINVQNSMCIFPKNRVAFWYNRQVVRNFDLQIIERLKDLFFIILLYPLLASLWGGVFIGENVKQD